MRMPGLRRICRACETTQAAEVLTLNRAITTTLFEDVSPSLDLATASVKYTPLNTPDAVGEAPRAATGFVSNS